VKVSVVSGRYEGMYGFLAFYKKAERENDFK